MNVPRIDLTDIEGPNAAPLVREALDEFGAIIFDVPEDSPPQIVHNIASSVDLHLYPYLGGDSPRTKIGGLDSVIYTATEFSATTPISLHSELSYASNYPDFLVFYCSRPAAHGGQTLLGRNSEITTALSASVRQTLSESHIEYRMSLGARRGMGRTWMATFETQDMQVAAARARHVGWSVAWMSGRMLLRQVRPSFVDYRGTAQWFNQIHQWHESALGDELRDEMHRLAGDDGLPRECFFAGGVTIPDDLVAEVSDVVGSVEDPVELPAGGVLILDNVALSHGRRPYIGSRTMSVGIARRNPPSDGVFR
jgi:hypothetical protein